MSQGIHGLTLTLDDIRSNVCSTVSGIKRRISKSICSYFNRIPFTLEQVTEYCSKNPEIELWYRPLPPSIKGMTIWEQDMFIVVCNAKETNGRVRLKIVLHELGHYLLHRGFLENGKCARAGTEWFADQFEKEASLFALIAIAPDELVKRICNQYNEFDECVRHLEQEYTFTQEEAVVRIASYDAELRMISYQRVIDRFLAR